jgi:hypothetical protein
MFQKILPRPEVSLENFIKHLKKNEFDFMQYFPEIEGGKRSNLQGQPAVRNCFLTAGRYFNCTCYMWWLPT